MSHTQPWFVQVNLPKWFESYLPSYLGIPLDDAHAMDLAIALSAKNIQHHTGGPFGAVITNSHGFLVAAAVNLVTSSGQSWTHAEMLALTLAQIHTGCLDLRKAPLAPLSLYSSAEPCAMCLGAVPWSGIARVVIGAREEDILVAGFDEGDKPALGLASLHRWGIVVNADVQRQAAAAVLADYARQGGAVYQPPPLREQGCE